MDACGEYSRGRPEGVHSWASVTEQFGAKQVPALLQQATHHPMLEVAVLQHCLHLSGIISAGQRQLRPAEVGKARSRWKIRLDRMTRNRVAQSTVQAFAIATSRNATRPR